MTTTAKNFEHGREGHSVQIIALHSAENQELPGQALHLLQWFAGSTAPEASANEIVDNKEILESVADSDTSWELANKALNLIAWGIEITGHASNTAAQWGDPYETETLKNAVIAVKAEMIKRGIPPIHLTDSQIRAAVAGDPTIKGIITHADATRALSIAGGHTDPGPNFPLLQFLAQLKI